MNTPDLVEQVADQYRRDGYVVLIRPSAAERPPFLANLEVDLIAKRANENVVVEVKNGAGTNRRAEIEVGYLASVVNDEPGWRFDLVRLNSSPDSDEFVRQGEERSEVEIRAMASEARQLVQLKMLEPALLVAWAAFEAAMRQAAHREGIPLDRKAPQFVLSTVTIEGLISKEEYEIARQAMRSRNAIAHGLKDQLDSDLPIAIAEITEHLLDGQPAATQ